MPTPSARRAAGEREEERGQALVAAEVEREIRERRPAGFDEGGFALLRAPDAVYVVPRLRGTEVERSLEIVAENAMTTYSS